MTTYTATYSPEDNKLRLYASQRLDDETYQRIKAAGFQWAPKQDLFYAPTWSPKREDILIELAGEIDDEDTSLVDRAEERADRFDGYQANRKRDAENAAEGVKRIADGIPMGQPILVGHHSERHARKDAERIDNGMRKAVKMWETASYWQARAAGAISHAKYKERPEVRARRIKTIEADRRKVERNKANALLMIKLWERIHEPAKKKDGTDATPLDIALFIANYKDHLHVSFSLADYPRDPPASQYEGPSSLWSGLKDGIIGPDKAAELAIAAHSRYLPHAHRWIAHYTNRLTYERAMLEEQGATHLLDPKPRRELMPLLNYRAPGGSITTENQWNRGSNITYRQVDMTKAEYAKIYTDYKGARLGPDKAHRFRTAMIRHDLVSVFITDSKEHPAPTGEALPPPHPAARIPDPPAPTYRTPRAEADPQASLFDAMRQTLRNGGVQVVAVPQLFPTPRDLADRMAKEAGIEAGHRVLEPSAGTGNLIGAMGCLWHVDGGALVAVEINHQLAGRLRQDYPLTDVRAADFLACNGDLGTFDRIIMNPPFQNGSDIEHIEHARKFLRPGGRLVAICANGPRQRAKLMPIADTWEDLPPDTFKDQGTGVNTALLVIEA